MKHIKTYHCLQLPDGIVVEGPVPYEILSKYSFNEGLSSFRESEEQFKAILDISTLEEGRIIAARKDNEIIGYATFLYPDPLERWSEENMDNLLELGAIEIARDYRQRSLGKKILQVAMMDPAMEDYIIISTEYYWHWDLKGTGLNVWEYRKVMEKIMAAGGLQWYATDDEEITSHPANCLMARIGSRVDYESIEKFDRLRFKYNFRF